jgi:hypothetical protein
MIDIRIGLGSGKIVAVLALDAHPHPFASGAPSLHGTRCLGVSVALSWSGETIAEFLKRLIAVMGRPAGSMLAKLRASLDQLPACKALINRFRRDAIGRLECQKIFKRGGLSHTTRALCEPLIETMASAALHREFRAYLRL